MPLEDVRWALDAAQRFCDERGVEFGAYPMHELAAHSDAAEILRLFGDRFGAEFEPLTTTGVPLAVRDDWREVLAAAREVGTTTVWLAFHGYGDEHDRQVNRRGAFDESLLAAERAHEVGMRVGSNVFVTKRNASHFDRMLAALESIDELSIEPARYERTRRGRRYGALHPTLDDLAPLRERALERTSLHCEEWRELEAHTEASYVVRALSGEWPARPPAGGHVTLVCRPNLDLYAGTAGNYGARYGNLREQGAEAVLARVLDEPPPPEADVDVAWLAAEAGDPEGREIHFEAESMRNRWLDRL
jgi:hypothetical protein